MLKKIMDDKNMPKAHSKALDAYNFSGSKYSNQDRVLVAVTYIVEGTASRTSKLTGVPDSTIRSWRKSDWWTQLVIEVRDEKEEEFRAGFTRIIEAAQARVEEALDQGETKLVKTKDGYEERQVPVGAKDAVMIGAISYDKLRISQNLPTSISSSADPKGILAKLEELSDRLDQREASVVDEQ